MNAHMPEPELMASVQIKDKNVRIPVMDAEGKEKLGEICFNPEDDRTYQKFIDVAQMLREGGKKVKAIEIDEAGLKEIQEKELETLDDFEQAMKVFESLGAAVKITAETWDSVCAGLDEIFGAGVCAIFTQGQVDGELLEPLFNAVTPYFRQERNKKVTKYKA